MNGVNPNPIQQTLTTALAQATASILGYKIFEVKLGVALEYAAKYLSDGRTDERKEPLTHIETTQWAATVATTAAVAILTLQVITYIFAFILSFVASITNIVIIPSALVLIASTLVINDPAEDKGISSRFSETAKKAGEIAMHLRRESAGHESIASFDLKES